MEVNLLAKMPGCLNGCQHSIHPDILQYQLYAGRATVR